MNIMNLMIDLILEHVHFKNDCDYLSDLKIIKNKVNNDHIFNSLFKNRIYRLIKSCF